MDTRTCEICGRTFGPTWSYQFVCSFECRIKHDIEVGGKSHDVAYERELFRSGMTTLARKDFTPIGTRIRNAVVDTYGSVCAYCGERQLRDDLEMDHVIPISNYGSRDARNIVPACRSCNSMKRSFRLPRDIEQLFIGDY